MVKETAVHLVWWVAELPGRLSAGMQKSYKKVFFSQKEAGRPYNFFGAADWPTLYNLHSYFVLNHIIDNYDIYMTMVI